MKEVGQRLFYCATRLALLTVGLAPLAFWAMLLGAELTRPHTGAAHPDYAIWLMPALMTAVPISAVLGVWLKSRRASAEDLAFFSQIKFALWSAAVWLSGIAPLFLGFRLEEKLGGIGFPISLLVLGAGVFRQPQHRGFLFLMWISSMSALMLSGLPTC